ncbi:Ubiquitin-conjugating enzyme E2 6 [Sphaceloma murrayae]|uniref:Ubiquitin-conjugating enzyme E2 6 n=1 Tax=Sphaceloma murrayae TaxID=2082308 RepID=A0A2K1QJ05_9PEZI|nr:Ubiquitin-conjugating enzyme E2 6 [Sphaceloma murrayae]
MPRKKFIQDLDAARTTAKPDDIHDIERGMDDGSFTFLISHAQLPRPAKVIVMITDLSSYPSSHESMIFTDDDAPAAIAKAINDHLPSTDGKSVLDIFGCVRTALSKLGSDMVNDDDMQSEDENADSDYDLNVEYIDAPIRSLAVRGSAGRPMPVAEANRIRQDLRTAKDAGFRVAPLGFLFEQGGPAIISLSCKVKKLGLSAEAMKTWQLRPDEYLVLLLRFPSGYRTAEQLQAPSGTAFDVRLRVADTYKIPLQDALDAFLLNEKGPWRQTPAKELPSSRETFISGPIRGLMIERLTKLIAYRETGMDWSAAEHCYIENQGRAHGHHSTKAGVPEYCTGKSNYPAIVTADHLTQRSHTRQISFPLVAMQFALRHFVRCTEFCLICHRRLPGDVEALKPYVCSQPLCLYQYMSLGFGPSIDHEILTQPLVVDLLISFCYSSVVGSVMKDFPVGLGLVVPSSFSPVAPGPPRLTRLSTKDGVQADIIAKLDLSRHEMVVANASHACPFRTGDWIICQSTRDEKTAFHCRISDITYYPTVSVGQLIRFLDKDTSSVSDTSSSVAGSGRSLALPGISTARAAPEWTEMRIRKYDQDFDSLDIGEKRHAIKLLLDTLPGVLEMQRYLREAPNREVKNWIDRISPSASSVLRWIVASNRACILQVDDLSPQGSDSKDPLAARQPTVKYDFDNEERVSGMRGWMQFRFAMGAPDKERRFMQAVKDTTKRLNLKVPTIFAWHGSTLSNWHSIIREGLHYRKTSNGRAYGNGVYHSQDCKISLAYSMSSRASPNGRSIAVGWPSSVLQVATALSLNELVNAPAEFISSNPHLVISNLDWIQTRYLFVKIKNVDVMLESDGQPSSVLQQARGRVPTGETGEPIVLPASASNTKAMDLQVTPAKRKIKFTMSRSSKISKKGSGTRDDPMDLDGDGDRSSVATEDEDRQALIDVDKDATAGAEVVVISDEGDLFKNTRFRPGHLDFSKLPKMPSPSYASPPTSRRLQADFKALLKTQSSTPAHQLGWYIDPSKLDNMYQWIIELHSFDQFQLPGGKTIPLAADMEHAGMSSIVLEMRFGPSYPFAPPFVRVLRPRFIGFREGGGGHVTIGGALCMELLTNSGWSSVSSIESVLLQVRLAMASTDPPARLALDTDCRRGAAHTNDYSVGEAVEAYKRACAAHGWAVPADLQSVVQEAGEEQEIQL